MSENFLATAEVLALPGQLERAELTESVLPLPDGSFEFHDIPQGRVWTVNPDLELSVTTRLYPPPLAGSALYGSDPDMRLVVTKRGVGRTNIRTGQTLWGPTVEVGMDSRPNHVAVDPAGRLMFTTLVYGFENATGGLYRLEHDGTISCVIKGVILGNGFGFSLDGRLLYFIDSTEPVVWVYDYDVETGKASRKRLFAAVCDNLPFGEALPDALVIGADGEVIVTEWGLGRVVILDTEGSLIGAISVPTARPTMAAVGGPNDGIMLITSEKGPDDGGGGGAYIADVSEHVQGQRPTAVVVIENDDAVFCHMK